MLKNTIKFFVVPAIALVLTAKAYNFMDSFFDKNFKSDKVDNKGVALIGGAFNLTNQDGKEIKDTDFRGKFMLVYFGFTSCPDVCPTDLARMTQVMEGLGTSAEGIQPIFITVDPERDNVEKMKEYVKSFYPKLQALTGDKQQISKVAGEYRVFYQKAGEKDAENYGMEHSSYMYLMDKEGKYITHFGSDQNVEIVTAAIKKYL